MKTAQILITLLLVSACFGACADEAEQIYNQTCVVCHGDGAEGAPRPGVKSEWEERLAYGIEELYVSAIEGLGPTMPPRGMCMDCSDAQLKEIVDFMIRDLK